MRKNHKDLYAALEAASGFHPEDDLEVLGPQHFTLPAGLLLAGVIIAFIILLVEILVKKYQDKKVQAAGSDK